MSDSKTVVQGGGVSFLGLLFLLFLALKLTGYITWSWWYVTMPLWGGLAIFLSGLALFIVGGGLVVLFAAIYDRITKK